MKVCLVQSLIGAGGGNDAVLKQMLDSLKENDITVYTNSKPLIEINQKVETKFPIKLPYFGLYQQLLGWKTPENFKRLDVIIVLSGNMVINTTGKKMYHCNQNNFGDVTENTISKYKSGMWSLYYFPFKLTLKSLQKKIKNSNIEFIGNSKYVGYKMMQKYGKEIKVIYPPVNLKEFKDWKRNNK